MKRLAGVNTKFVSAKSLKKWVNIRLTKMSVPEDMAARCRN